NVTEAEVDSLTRSSILVMTTVTTVTVMVDAPAVTKEKPVALSLFAAGSSSVGRTGPTPGGFSDLTGSDFLVGGIHTVIDPDSNLLDEFAPPKFFASVRGMERDQLFVEFNVGAAHQMTLSAEVRMHAEYNIKEKRRLKSVVDDQTELLKVREKEIGDLRAQLLVKETEATKAIHRNTTLEKEKGELDVKVADLAASVKVREQEVADLDVVVTSVKSQNDNLVNQ
ncbi:hypothetical protein Tco_0125829, partial [Tanacetum coccineum]